MSKEGGEVEVSGQRRKSARILALEEEKKEKQKCDSCAAANNTYNLSSKAKASLSGINIGSFQYQQLQDHDHVFPSKSSTMPPPSLPSLKRGRKQKRLEDLDLFSLAQSQSQQDRENHTDGNSSIKNDQQPTGVSPIQWIPEKRILECVLDILQRRDKYKIFGQPVNPQEVDTYYSIIKEPMDFGTMRTKLHEGKYTSLEQFEARRMQVLAQMVFGALRTDPYKLESQFSLTRGRPTKRLPTISEIKGPRTRLARPSVLKFGASELGSRDGENSTSPKRGRPPIYRPWECFVSENESLVSSIYNAPKILVESEDKGDNYGYKESLLRFVKDLGPAAQKVAASKLIKCLPKPPNPSQTPLIPPHQTTQTLVLPSPSCPQSTNIASSYNLLHNLPAGSSNLAYNQQNNTFLNPLNIQSSTQGNPLISSSSGIQIRDPIDRGILKTNNNLMFPLKEPSQGHDHVLGKRPILMDNITSTNFNVFGSSFTGNRTYPRDQNLSTTIRQNLAQHKQQKKTNIQNSKFWLASHLRVIPVHNPNTGKRFMKTIDMIAEANKLQKGKQLQIVEHDNELFSSNWQSMLRGKQPVVGDHDLDDDEQLSSTNWQSRLEDFVNKNNIFDLKSTSGSSQAGTSGNNWQYLMNSNSMCNSTETDQFLEGFRNGISSLQMLLSNDHQDHNPFPCGSSSSAQLGILPMPLYNETSCIVHERAGASSSAEYHHDRRPDFSTQELLLWKDSQQPDLALQL
ncbi:Bromodomain and PHD finger-containing protein 3 [Morus notabilis]|uniref:Bromodomain and PHD finger-containing protein 3 n=1 Tax=Morus notabilis TaxID=981085 RepID=W9R879_9ROSA|nr:Bromodomain and PHD finger-containing protein 3 [Morus notabilis]